MWHMSIPASEQKLKEPWCSTIFSSLPRDQQCLTWGCSVSPSPRGTRASSRATATRGAFRNLSKRKTYDAVNHRDLGGHLLPECNLAD